MVKVSSALITAGFAGIALSLIIFVAIFYPVVKLELNYQIQEKFKPSQTKNIEPLDRQFGIVVPKIGANAKIVAEVDPFSRWEYQLALTKGVAHAKGTSLPGQMGNIFLFSHSSVNFYEASRYNSIFYLLDKMEAGDQIELYFRGEKFTYLVSDKKIVSASEVGYLKGEGEGKTITLMTCYPAGTSFKRLLVLGELLKP